MTDELDWARAVLERMENPPGRHGPIRVAGKFGDFVANDQDIIAECQYHTDAPATALLLSIWPQLLAHVRTTRVVMTTDPVDLTEEQWQAWIDADDALIAAIREHRERNGG